MSGFYNIDVYDDINLGLILKIKKEELDYIEYDNEIEINLSYHTDINLSYEVDDYLLYKNSYKYKVIGDKYFITIEDKINDIELGKILEFTKDILIN